MKTIGEVLSSMDYPGRFFVLGKNSDDSNLVIYGITGRSPASQVRKIVAEAKSLEHLVLHVVPIGVSYGGNPKLLYYNAVVARKFGNSSYIIVSNGKQTDTIDNLLALEGLHALTLAHEKHDYEPDFPNFTPRISGIIASNYGVIGRIMKSEEDSNAIRSEFRYVFSPGTGRFIRTYSGEDTNPLLTFRSEPIEVVLDYKDVLGAVDDIYSSFANQEKSMVVSVAGVSSTENHVGAYISNTMEIK